MATRDELLDQIPGLASGDVRAPAAQRRSLLEPETEFGRNVSNTLNAVPLGTSTRLAQRAVTSLPRMIQSGEVANLARNVAPAVTPARVAGAGLRTAASAPVAAGAALATLAARGSDAPPAPPTPAAAPEARVGLGASPVYSKLADGSVVSSQLDGEGRPQGIFRKGSPYARSITPGVSVGDPGDADLALQREARAAEIYGSIRPDPTAPTPGVFGIENGTAARNARFDREVAASRLESASRLAGSSRERAAAASALANNYETDARRDMATEQNATTRQLEGLRGAIAQRGQDLAAGTARRGQDLDYEASVYGSDARNAIARAQLASTERDKADARASARSDFTVNLFKGEFTAKDKDGKEVFDEVGARRAADALNRIAPNFSALPKAEQEQKKFDAILAARQAAQLAQPAQIGLDALNPLAERPARNERTPDIRGGSLEKYGLFRGAITPGVSAEDYVVTGADGRRYNVGNLSLDEIEQYRRDMAR